MSNRIELKKVGAELQLWIDGVYSGNRVTPAQCLSRAKAAEKLTYIGEQIVARLDAQEAP